ncbi:MAG: type II toxin-antitoxin system RelB/DinJ family antitoxin [Fibromonadaceae bacterium]|jgi:DNA-damage-inducible protein J|nr:type II toxin-antitoxin system RelB/DinJ family antitoxin [Fibromonadaceae bacterium]
MPSTQITAKVNKSQKAQFERIAKSIGTTPANALKMFIVKFNYTQGFPFELKMENQYIEELEDIIDANEADRITQEMIDNNVDINTLTTNKEMKRKYGL